MTDVKAIFAYPEHKLHYFIVIVMICEHHDHILMNQLTFDELTMFFKSLTGLFSPDVVLDADKLYYDFLLYTTKVEKQA